MARTTEEIRSKDSTLTVQDLRRLLFRCAAILISQSKVRSQFRQGLINKPVFQCEYELLHYIVALPFEVATPSAIATGIEVWTWVIAEKSDVEVALMSEVLSAWSDNIKHEKGIFSTSVKYVINSFCMDVSSDIPKL